MTGQLNIVILGLSITSSWGNGHATTYRGLMRELVAKGHQVTFLERDKPWYAAHRDLPQPPYGSTILYGSVQELAEKHHALVRDADLVIVGSYVPEGVAIGEWVTKTTKGIPAFYDIDTPVTLSKLARRDFEYLSTDLIPRYRLYLSFTGGPTLRKLERELGSPMACALYCSVDPSLYSPQEVERRWKLGYLGTYSDDRQEPLDLLMLEAARRIPEQRFVVAGPQYPASIVWPENVDRMEHLPAAEHRAFYCMQDFTMNITRADMIRAGYSPSVRLFEAAACATPIISDPWDGLGTFFEIGTEILVTHSAKQTSGYLRELTERERRDIGQRGMQRVLSAHTAAHRAAEVEEYIREISKKG